MSLTRPMRCMDDLTKDQRHKVMSKIRSRDTKPEVLLRKALWRRGIRYRKNVKDLPGKPDIAVAKHRLAVFVDGEYFHGKNWEDGGREKAESGANASYWVPKIERNILRDENTEAELKGLGWRVMRFWSRDILKDPDKCAEDVIEFIHESERPL